MSLKKNHIHFSVLDLLKSKNTPYATAVAEAIRYRARKNFVFTEGKHFACFVSLDITFILYFFVLNYCHYSGGQTDGKK